MLIGVSRGAVVAGLFLAGSAQAALPTFDTPASYNVGDQADSLVAADFNGDRYSDVAAVNYAAGTVVVVFNDKHGAFGAAASYAACAHPRWMVSGDVNGDKHLDLIVGCLGASSDPGVSVLENNGDGTFAAPVNYSVAAGLTAVTLLDVDGVHGPDIITAHGNDWIAGSGSVGLLTNNGDGSFSAEVTANAGNGAINALALIDLDGDSRLDVLALGNDACCDANRWLKFDRVSGAFGAATRFDGLSSGINASPSCVAVGDLNGDGRPDLVIGDGNKYTLSSVAARPDGTFIQVDTAMSGYPCPVTMADLNKDGSPDVVAGALMMVNDRLGNLWPVDDPAGAKETGVIAADIDRDSDLDLLSINTVTGALTVRTSLAVSGGAGGAGSSGGGGSAGLPMLAGLLVVLLSRRERRREGAVQQREG